MAQRNSFFRNANFLYWIILIFALGLICLHHGQLITLPFQVTSGEGVPVLFTRRLIEGINPYTVEMMPTYANGYGQIFYNLLLLPFAYVFGPDLAFHRTASCIAIIISISILYFEFRKVGGNYPLSFNLSLIWWAQVLVLLNPLARVDAIGSIFFMLAIATPHLTNFSRKGFFAAAIFSVCGFFVKQYFFLSGLVLTITSFFLIGPTFSIILTTLMVFLLVTVLIIFSLLFPTYIENSILIGSNYYAFSLKHLGSQLIHLAKENLFLLFFGFVLVFWSIARLIRHRSPILKINEFSINRVKIGAAIIAHYHLFALGLILPFALIAQGMSGSYLCAYVIQLIIPLVFICLTKYGTKFFSSALSVCAAFNLIWAISAFPKVKWSNDQKYWQEWTQIISNKQNIYAPQNLGVLLDDLGKPVYDAGLSHIFQFSLQNARLGNAWLILHLREYNDRKIKMLENKKFDLVISRHPTGKDRLSPNFLQNYRLVKTLHLPSGMGNAPSRGKKAKESLNLFDLFEPKIP